MGDGCKMYLGPTGTIRSTEFTGDPGIYKFDRLTVAADGEVSHLPGADPTEQNLTVIVSWYQIELYYHYYMSPNSQFIAIFNLDFNVYCKSLSSWE